MADLETMLPSDNAAALASLYAGGLYRLPANEASVRLVDRVWAAAEEVYGGNPRTAQFRLDETDFFARTGVLRKRFFTDPASIADMGAVLRSHGFDPAANACDPPRLRLIRHDGHTVEAARAMYYGHRDTWYSNPQSMLTWWLPLHDVGAAETFEFFPAEFGRPVANDSEIFDFDEWTQGGESKRIGWQKRQTGLAAYPRLLEEPRGAVVPVEARRGEVVLFSAQHLHRTVRQSTGRSRLSIDFRSVRLADASAGGGAVNVDNRSTGSSLPRFVRFDAGGRPLQSAAVD